MFKWLVKRFNDYFARLEREQAAEEAKWNHMFQRLWESRQRERDEWIASEKELKRVRER
jgi:hypothetical protein